MAELVVVETGNGGMPRACVCGARADAEVYLQGGHVTRWQPHGAEPVLFLSRRAAYAPGKAIRGGVPLIFPWFGPHATDRRAPIHGFAHSRPWRLVTSGPGADGAVVLELGLEDDEATRAAWPSAFSLRYRVTGLGDTPYIDKVDAMTRKQHGAEPLRLTGETDRVFLGTRARCVVTDRALGRRLIVDKTGSATTVVWNPWSAKAAEIADLEPDDWRRLVCVETANAADDAVTLAAGARHVMSATIRAEAGA